MTLSTASKQSPSAMFSPLASRKRYFHSDRSRIRQCSTPFSNPAANPFLKHPTVFLVEAREEEYRIILRAQQRERHQQFYPISAPEPGVPHPVSQHRGRQRQQYRQQVYRPEVTRQ